MADRPGALLKGSALAPAVQHLLSLQRKDGCWEGEVVWCTMILSQYVIVRHVVGRPIDEPARAAILRHYAATRTAEGGWPLHREGPAQVFTTTLAYVALRLAGAEADHELAAPARRWLHRQPGGVLGVPTWGKFWLALLGLYEDEGLSALPPELFVAPSWMPVHPRRWYCHTRCIYLGMAYLYGRQFVAGLGELGDALRRELYDQPYETIDFAAHRQHVSPVDLYAPPTRTRLALGRLVTAIDRAAPASLRRRALERSFEQILYEQRTSRHQAISPVNGLLNCLAIFAKDPQHPELQPSLDGLEAWRWHDEAAGTRYAGARSQTWDTAFAARALVASLRVVPLPPDADSKDALRRAHRFLTSAQLVEELPDRQRHHRAGIRGGWCFSDGAHRWPVSDCTAEALAALLEIEAVPDLVPEEERLPKERVRDAVAFMLARQNGDGGFGTYERARGPEWLDRLNPSEMFRGCMIDRSHVECTASVVEALAKLRAVSPELLTSAARDALSNAAAFLRLTQRPDGSYPGAWGINFTYAIFHVVKALRAAGVASSDPAIARAAAWLTRTQRADGGWGEQFSSCLTGEYVEHPESQAVMTSWAVLALAEASAASEAAARGAAWLQSHQRDDGSWPQEAVNGVFFGTAMLDYALYRAYFPLWALARAAGSGSRIADRGWRSPTSSR